MGPHQIKAFIHRHKLVMLMSVGYLMLLLAWYEGLGRALLTLGLLPMLVACWYHGLRTGLIIAGLQTVGQVLIMHGLGTSWQQLAEMYITVGSITGNGVSLLLAIIFAHLASLLKEHRYQIQRLNILGTISEKAYHPQDIRLILAETADSLRKHLQASSSFVIMTKPDHKQPTDSSSIMSQDSMDYFTAHPVLLNRTANLPHEVRDWINRQNHLQNSVDWVSCSVVWQQELQAVLLLACSQHLSINPATRQFLSTCTNILATTLQHQHEQANTKNKYAELICMFDNMASGVIVVDVNTYQIIYMNIRATEWWGDGIGKSCYHYLNQLNKPCDFCPNQQIIQSNRQQKHIWEKYDNKLNEWFMLSDSILTWPDGRLVKFQIATIITDLKCSQLELKSQANLLEALIDNIPSPIFYKATSGHYLGCNQAFADFLSRDKREIIGATAFDLCPPDLAKRYQDADQILLKEKKVQIYEASVQYADGSRHDVVFHKAVFTNTEGNIGGLVGVMLDISQRKRLETERLHQQKMSSIGQLAAGIAHEINTPIQFIGDNLQFIEECHLPLINLLSTLKQTLATTTSPTKEHYASIQALLDKADIDYYQEEMPSAISQSLEGVGRISSIVKAMKDFAHPGGQEKAPADIHQIINNAITVSKNEWKYVAKIVCDFESTLPHLDCHTGELGQVILNMIVNAAHAISDKYGQSSALKGRIEIKTQSENELLVITISDNGSGIPEDIKNQIFDPFFTTKPVGQGTGQGLAIAHSVVVDKHQGRIDVSSQHGQGTYFTITLPYKSASKT